MKINCLRVLLLTAGVAVAQPAGRTFEVASIKIMPPPEGGRMAISMEDDPGRIDWKGVPLKFLIAQAYGVKDFQIAGPDWMATQRFELSAKLPEGATNRQVPEMLRVLLQDRFKLQTHKETREMQVYALTVGKGGLKIKPVDDDNGMVRIGAGRIQLNGAPMNQLATVLARMLDRPVLNETGVSGNFDIKLEFSPENSTGPGGATSTTSDNAAPSVFTALQEQAGLKLDSKKAPVELVVVDRVEKLPTEN